MQQLAKVIDLFPAGEPDREAVEALVSIYRDSSIEGLLNSLHGLAAKVAIASGVSPENFAAGVKHHWDFLANSLNEFEANK